MSLWCPASSNRSTAWREGSILNAPAEAFKSNVCKFNIGIIFPRNKMVWNHDLWIPDVLSYGLIWGSVKIPCWPACLESLGHRSGWGPHRFTWFGYMVLISVLICKGIPLSWSRSDLVSAWHLGGLRCPWPPSSNASPQRWSSTAQKKNWQHTHLQIHRPHFFGRGAQRSFVFLFTFLVSINIQEST